MIFSTFQQKVCLQLENRSKPFVQHQCRYLPQFCQSANKLVGGGILYSFARCFVNNEEDDGFKHYTRINGSGAKVLGVNLEGKLAFDKVQLQAGLTLTSNKFDKAEEWGERTALTSGSTFAVDGSNFAKDADGNYENQKQEDRAMTRTPMLMTTLRWVGILSIR